MIHEVPAIAIASFPKSGNTFVRTFLSELGGGDIPDRYRAQKIGLRIPCNGENCALYKTHDARPINLLFGRELRHVGILHVIRHPIDVFLSWLNYLLLEGKKLPRADLSVAPGSFPFVKEFKAEGVQNISSDHMACLMGAYMALGRLSPGFAVVRNWHDHAASYLHSARSYPVWTIAYEHLVERPEEAFGCIGGLFGASGADVTEALERTRQATKPDGGFFWRQKAYGHTELLSQEHIDWFGRVKAADLKLFETALAVSAANIEQGFRPALRQP